MNTVSLKDCQELEKAGYSQELEVGAPYYTPTGKIYYYGTQDSIAYRRIPDDNDRNECIAIPELEPLLKWFPSFAERWIKYKKMSNNWKFCIDYHNWPDVDGTWVVAIKTDRKCKHLEGVMEGSQSIHNPSPLLAVVELCMQMIKEMEDEDSS